MLDAQSIQVSIILCEAFFCFLAGILMHFNKIASRKEIIFITACNHSSALFLLMDFLTYVFEGQEGKLAYVMVRISNGMFYAMDAVIALLFTMFLCQQFFGNYGVKSDNPCKYPVRTAYAALAVAVLFLIISQFTGWLYSIDEMNVYQRGPFYSIFIALSAYSFLVDVWLIISYIKTVNKLRRVTIISITVIAALGIVLQVLTPGGSWISIAIGVAFVILFVDSNVNLNQEVVKAAKTEARTGIANEHGCIDFLDSMDKDERMKYTVIFFDITRFGLINQRYGMMVGNKMILAYAKKAEELLEEDEILARQGSDKFIAVVKREREQLFLHFLENANISILYEGNMYEANISATAGVYRIDSTQLMGEFMISMAAIALNVAKTKTGHAVEYMNDEIMEGVETARLVESEIPAAIRNEEFLVYYQPKVNSRTNLLCGAEALVRWLHNGELVPPGKFVPIMEKNDSMCKLDFYMLEHVCADISNWMEKGLVPPRISVNFSRRNLSDPKLAKNIDRVVVSHHIPKKLIEIEITETNDEFPIQVLKGFIDQLHSFGYQVAIDDFGCGSSSLSLLREATFDTLKIDKGFVDRSHEKDLTILSHIIQLAKSIDTEVLAEGVEMKEQVETLASMGCDVIQGYYYDKPLPKDTFEMRIRTRKYEDK